NFYVAQFKNSSVLEAVRYGANEPAPEGALKRGLFSLAGEHFMAFDSGIPHPFSFTPATSFIASCDTQAEIDELWKNLSTGQFEQCGWLCDKFGVSWQVVPTALSEMLLENDSVKSD